MALLSIPLWVTPPNWSSPVIEALEWLTGVYTSLTGVEQRQSLRLAPRRTLEFSATVGGQDRGFLEHQLDRYGGGEFYLPVWYESGRLAVSSPAGSTLLRVAGERTELSRATAVVVQGSRPYNWVIAEVSSGATTGGETRLTLASPGLQAAVSLGSKVYPAVRSRLSEDSGSVTRASSAVVTAQVRFDFLDPSDWPDDPGLGVYDSYPFVVLPFNERTPVTGSSKRLFLSADNDTGKRLRADLAGIAFPGMSGTHTQFGRWRADYLRSVLYSLRGRAGAAWFVPPVVDLRLVAPVAAGSNQILVARDGFTDTGGPTDERREISIMFRGGDALGFRVSGAAVVGDGDTELLTLAWDTPYGFGPSDVSRISFMMFGRFDQDRFELNHLTDTDGVVEMSAAYRRVPDLRIATDWSPLPFSNDTEV